MSVREPTVKGSFLIFFWPFHLISGHLAAARYRATVLFLRPITALLAGTPKARVHRRTRISSLKLIPILILGKVLAFRKEQVDKPGFWETSLRHRDISTLQLFQVFKFKALNLRPWKKSSCQGATMPAMSKIAGAATGTAALMAASAFVAPGSQGTRWGGNKMLGCSCVAACAKSNMIWHDTTW